MAKVGSESELGDFNDWLGSIKHKYQHMLVIAGILTWIFSHSHLAGLFDFLFFWVVVVVEYRILILNYLKFVGFSRSCFFLQATTTIGTRIGA